MGLMDELNDKKNLNNQNQSSESSRTKESENGKILHEQQVQLNKIESAVNKKKVKWNMGLMEELNDKKNLNKQNQSSERSRTKENEIGKILHEKQVQLNKIESAVNKKNENE